MPGGGFWAQTKPPPGVALDPGQALMQGLVGCWSLATGAGAPGDLTGHAAPSTFHGSVAWGAGDRGPALVLPGSSGDYVSTPSYAALRSGLLTVAAYARVTTATPGVVVCVNYDGSSVPLLLVMGGAGIVVGTGAQFSSFTSATGWISTADGGDWRDGAWHWLVGTYDGTVLRVYVDGVLRGTSPVQAGLCATTNTNTLDFGTYQNNTWTMTGAIGSILFWNRALTSPQIAQFCAQPYALFAPPVWRRFGVPVTVQLAYPTSDVSAGSWRSNTGATTSLYSYVDEPTTPNDSDYILSSPNPSSDQAELHLGTLTDPGVDTGHILHVRRRQR